MLSSFVFDGRRQSPPLGASLRHTCRDRACVSPSQNPGDAAAGPWRAAHRKSASASAYNDHSLEEGAVQRMTVRVLVYSLPLRAAFLRSARGIVDPI